MSQTAENNSKSTKTLTADRLEDILISIMEHAIDTSDTLGAELVRFSGMTKSELHAIGYEEEHFPELYAEAEDD